VVFTKKRRPQRERREPGGAGLRGKGGIKSIYCQKKRKRKPNQAARKRGKKSDAGSGKEKKEKVALVS